MVSQQPTEVVYPQGLTLQHTVTEGRYPDRSEPTVRLKASGRGVVCRPLSATWHTAVIGDVGTRSPMIRRRNSRNVAALTDEQAYHHRVDGIDDLTADFSGHGKVDMTGLEKEDEGKNAKEQRQAPIAVVVTTPMEFELCSTLEVRNES